ncbi:MAG: diacylglycerol kinase [Pseudomonadales bacterium]|nr:diacylglycerol kinase [Pseudomonadales bacterium]MCP5189662.1 diacylglycerol kinase [Pseudomonadales bacterium]
MSNQTKRHTGLARIWQATLNSRRALVWLVRNESAFRQELFLLIVLGAASLTLDISALQRCALLVSLLVILLVEILNTAIETTIDRIDTAQHPMSGLAKDLGSAAVFVSLVIAGLVWISVLFFG